MVIAACASSASAQRLLIGPDGGIHCNEDTKASLRTLCNAADLSRRSVIQLDGPMTPKRRLLLEQAGVELGQYLPTNSFVARLHGADDAKLASIDFITWQAPFDPAWKLEANIGQRDYQTADRQEIAKLGHSLVTIHLFRDASQQEIDLVRAEIEAFPSAVFHRGEIVGGSTAMIALLPAGAPGAIADNTAVQHIEDVPEITYRRNDEVRGMVQTATPTGTPLYTQGLHGENQILGIMDGRADFNHCSLSDINPIGPTHRKVLANNAPVGTDAHGTHVSGTAVGDNGINDDTRGVAYAAKMVFNDTPSFTFSGMTGQLDLHHSQGARIHTNSWGNDLSTSYDGLARAIDMFMHNNEDDLVLFAVTNGAALRNPENAKNLLAVGASQRFPNQGTHCSGGVGPTDDGRRKPEIYAPGCNTNSASAGTPCSTVAFTGTSMAAPAVAGAAALVRQYYTEGWYPSGSLTPGNALTPSGALLKATLLNASSDMGSIAGYPSDQEGWGFLAADDSLFFAGDAHTLFVDDIRNANGITSGAAVDQPIQVTSSLEPLRVTLVWTEPAGAPGVLSPTVNDLDLVVIAPDNTTFFGNNFAAGISAPGGSSDTLNNVEQILIPSPDVGTWTIRVVGAAVNEGTQGYALVTTGSVTALPKELTLSAITPPTTIEPGVASTFQVNIQPGDESLVGGSPKLHYRFDASPFTITNLTIISGNTYEAALPAPACGDIPQFFVAADGSVSGEHRAPFDAPTAVFSAEVGVLQTTTVYSENFASGLPAGWTTSGLWGVNSLCAPSASCDGSPWAYYGNTGTCTYSTGAANSGQLVSVSIALPASDAITLSFCSYLTTENFAGVDEPSVSIEGVPVVLPSAFAQSSWETIEGDLTAFAGQSVQLTFAFDTQDGINNNFLGWFVDTIEIQASVLVCDTGTCEGDANGDNIVDVNDISFVLFRLGDPCGAPGCDGDVNADATVDVNDISFVLFRLGNPC